MSDEQQRDWTQATAVDLAVELLRRTEGAGHTARARVYDMLAEVGIADQAVAALLPPSGARGPR